LDAKFVSIFYLALMHPPLEGVGFMMINNFIAVIDPVKYNFDLSPKLWAEDFFA
jgi:hypothetical protein